MPVNEYIINIIAKGVGHKLLIITTKGTQENRYEDPQWRVDFIGGKFNIWINGIRYVSDIDKVKVDYYSVTSYQDYKDQMSRIYNQTNSTYRGNE